MYFAPDGTVRACCVNTEYPLGRIGEQTIREIWDGAQTASLRKALAGHDFSLGCQDCEHRIGAGDRAWSTAEQYDRYLADVPGRYPKRMDFILSISCNLQCAMCHGDLSSSIRLHREGRPPMAPAYGDDFFDELAEFLPHLERAVFLGGEPFVARESQRVWDLMLAGSFAGEVQVVTNGTQWNRRVERYLRELPMHVTVSIDGWTAETLEPLRVGVDRDQLFENVDRYQAAVEADGGTLSFHFCLMRQNWHEFGRFLLEADRRDVPTLVMTVTEPAGFSLWDLPLPDLEAVLQALDREDEALGPRLGRNRRVWDDERERVRRHVAALRSGAIPAWSVPVEEVSATPVSVGPRPDQREVVERCEADLRAWAGRPPVLVQAQGGVVESVEGPPWAASLGLDRWAGSRLESILDHVQISLGPASAPRSEEVAGGVVQTEVTYGSGRDEVRFRSLVVPDGDDRLSLAIATNASLERLSGIGS